MLVSWGFASGIAILAALIVWNYGIFPASVDGNDLDWLSFVVAEGLKLAMHDPFPRNITTEIEKARSKTIQTFSRVEPWILWLNPSLKEISYEELRIPVDDGQAEVALRLYNHQKERENTSAEGRSVLIYFHGGGWVVGSLAQSHFIALELAQLTDFLVVNADYRLAPEHVFPTPVNDAYAVLQWVIANIHAFGGNNQSIIVSGGSSGGNLAAAITSKHLIRRVEQICGYEVDFVNDTPLCSKIERLAARNERWHEIRGLWISGAPLNATSSSDHANRNANRSGTLTLKGIEWFRRLYQGTDDINEEIRSNYLFSPINTPKRIIAVYPPTVLTVARYDVLASENFEFAENLQRLNRRAKVDIFNTVHGFTSFHPFLGKKAMKQAVNELLVSVALQEMIHTSC